MTTDCRRLGVLGGTFDPIHVGHLEAADAARAALALDEVVFVPSNDPPHRPLNPQASAFHRFALVALAIEGRDGYRVSDLELLRPGVSYTARTLRDLHAQGWHARQIFFIVGADAFADIATWYDYPAILDLCHFAVIARPGNTLRASFDKTPLLASRRRALSESTAPLDHTAIFPIDADTSPVSSSEIRARLATGRSIDDMVAPAVAQHIARHRLYRRSGATNADP
jgi:nicotinate-nucleotide adenylyltransferase